MQLSELETERMIKDNMGLVHFHLQQQYPNYKKDEEYIQIGRIALWKAIKYYNPESGQSAFSTYAMIAIERSLSYYHKRKWAKHYQLNPVSFGSVSRDIPAETDDYANPEGEIWSQQFLDAVSSENPYRGEVLSRIAEGESIRSVARSLGVSRQSVRQICRRCRKYFGEEA